MDRTFSPASDFQRLEAAIAGLYAPGAVPAQVQRYQGLFEGYAAAFGPCGQAAVFSAPGRTEIGGNHTDHQHGKVLAGSVDLDIIAAVAPNGERVIRLQSEGFPMDVVDLDDLEARPEEYNRSVSILRGIAAWFARQGCRLEGFNAYTTSTVFKGSGLSSSAALEVLLGNSTPLYARLYREGLINQEFAYAYESDPGCAFLCALGESKDPEAVRAAVAEEARRIAREGVDPALWERVKKGVYGNRVRGLNSFENLCVGQAQAFFTGYDFLRFADIFDAITKEEAEELIASWVTGERTALSVVRAKEET